MAGSSAGGHCASKGEQDGLVLLHWADALLPVLTSIEVPKAFVAIDQLERSVARVLFDCVWQTVLLVAKPFYQALSEGQYRSAVRCWEGLAMLPMPLAA